MIFFHKDQLLNGKDFNFYTLYVDFTEVAKSVKQFLKKMASQRYSLFLHLHLNSVKFL